MCKDWKDLLGKVEAVKAVEQGPLFNTKKLMDLPEESIAYAAKTYTKQMERSLSAIDAAERVVNTLRTPEAVLPKTIFNRIDRKMDQFQKFYERAYGDKMRRLKDGAEKQIETAKKIGNKDLREARIRAIEDKLDRDLFPLRKQAEKLYKDNISKQFKANKQELQHLFRRFGGTARLDKELSRRGIKNKVQASILHSYLDYLENGGPFFQFRHTGEVGAWARAIVSNVTGNKVKWNLKTAFVNGMEVVQKAPATFGFKNTLLGIADTLNSAKKAGLSIFDQLPELKRKGAYDYDPSVLRVVSQADPLAKSQNMLDNFAYFIGNRGGDWRKGMKEIAFRPKPWNDTIAFQDVTSRSFFDFMSFQLRQMQQYGGWWRDIFTGKNVAASSKALFTYTLMTGLIYGDKAAIPAPLWQMTKGYFATDDLTEEDLDDVWDQLHDALGPAGDLVKKGVIGTVTGGQVDLGEYAQPFGGITLGVGTEMVNQLGNIGPASKKMIDTLGEGRPDKAALIAFNKLVQLSQLFKFGANASIQKSVDSITKSYVEDENFQKVFQEKLIGKDTLPKEPKNNSLDLDMDLDFDLDLDTGT